MKCPTRRSAWFARTLLLVPAAIIGCAEPPDAAIDRGDEGRVKLGTSSLVKRNFDARASHNASLRLGDSMAAPRLTGRLAAPDIAATFDETTGVTRTLQSRTGFLTGARSGSAESIALDFVRANLDALGLSPADLDGMELTDLVYSRVVGTTHIYYRQRHLGLPVYNGQLQINVHKDGSILSVNNAFVPNIGALASSISPSLGAEHAVASAAANLSVELPRQPRASATIGGVEQRTMVDAAGLSKAAVDSQLMWVPVNAKQVALAWRFQVETTDGNHMFDYTVDASTGSVWTRFDWTSSDSYRVYKEPVESANHSSPAQPADGRVLVADPANADASPLGWHNDGTTAFLINRGNNVHAYDDRDANNQPPLAQPACTTTRDCDFPVDFAAAPIAYTPAAITNLFYWNNLIHDVQYQYGFDEVGGNFQVSNLGNPGLGNDAVRAEAQDGGGTNNANFATPPDGSPPRMQMFEWTQTNPRRDGDFDNGIIVHEYGHGISNRLVGGPSNVSCLGNAQQGGEGWSDWFGLWYTVKVGDVGPTGRGIGTYALGQATGGPGIRLQRYSTDPAVNNHTYASIAGKAIPHGVGEVWAQALWEVYWALVDQHGFDPDLYNALGTAGNQRAMLYVTQGLKNTICSPTFVNARDGIIAAAAAAHGGEDVCRLWGAFAPFGLGVNAISGGANSTTPTNGFQVPPECLCNPQPIADAGPDQAICVGGSVTLGTPARPDTTYLWTPGGETTAQITVSPTATTTFTVRATTSCGSTTDSVTVTVENGEGGLRDTFEAGAVGWTTTGLWHLVNNSTCVTPSSTSGTRAFYYGQDATCNYNTGVANSGTLTSPAISGITSTSTFSFNSNRQVESFGGAFDQTQVDVIRSSGAATTVFSLNSSNPSVAGFVPSGLIPLGAFAGDTIRLRFTFNTVDGVSNRFRGWFIDDVTVTAGSACTSLTALAPVTLWEPVSAPLQSGPVSTLQPR
jgi:extracellular elastinolytic metalloproteinase